MKSNIIKYIEENKEAFYKKLLDEQKQKLKDVENYRKKIDQNKQENYEHDDKNSQP